MIFLLIAVGTALFVGSFFIPNGKGTLQNSGNKEMSALQIPTRWDEGEITRGLQMYRSNGNLLSQYVDGIVSRFVMGQDLRTLQARTAFLQTFNQFAEVARESYKWQRVLKGGRAEMEEDVADLKAKMDVERAKKALAEIAGDPEIAELQKEIERETLRLQLAALQKQKDDLLRPAAAPSAPPPRPSVEEQREGRRVKLRNREETILSAIRETEQDASLEPDIKQRKLNGLYDRLAKVHEEQADTL